MSFTAQMANICEKYKLPGFHITSNNLGYHPFPATAQTQQNILFHRQVAQTSFTLLLVTRDLTFKHPESEYFIFATI